MADVAELYANAGAERDVHGDPAAQIPAVHILIEVRGVEVDRTHSPTINREFDVDGGAEIGIREDAPDSPDISRAVGRGNQIDRGGGRVDLSVVVLWDRVATD